MILRPSAAIVNALTSRTGYRRANQGPGHGRSLHLHNGTDFPGELDEPVLAIAAGVVVRVTAQTTSGYVEPKYSNGVARASSIRNMKAPYGQGLLVAVRHSLEFPGLGFLYTAYNHLNTAIVRKGQRVLAGEPIGGVGKSGTNPIGGAIHLHLGASIGRSDDIGKRLCVDSRGLQHWTSEGGKEHRTPDPEGRTWLLEEIVVTPCFPKSGTNRGKAGVDGPAPSVLADGTLVSGRGGRYQLGPVRASSSAGGVAAFVTAALALAR